MSTFETALNQQTLDSLRVVRRKLYAIPESDLNAMSLEDQAKYGDSLHKVALALLKLEAAKLKEVNDEFKKREDELKNATAKLESDATSLSDAVKIIRIISGGIELITKIVALLG
jgi:hypothetical protein